MKLLPLLVLLFVAMQTTAETDNKTMPGAAELAKMASRYAPTPLSADTSKLSKGDREALVKLTQAGRIFNRIYMFQIWDGDVDLYAQLMKDETALGKARIHYFWINKSPWSDLDDFAAFIPGVPARKPLGANFYPIDMTRQEFESWVATLPPDQHTLAKGFFTVIKRRAAGAKGGGTFEIVPYSKEYSKELAQTSKLLREAAKLTTNESLKTFLNLRADAFQSNDYYASDMAWMDLDAPLDITIGPYETYNDELFGYKAAFEAYINVRDDAETAKLSAFSQHLQDIENNLPLDPQYRNPKLGAAAPIRVVDQVLSAGDGAHGVQTAAYNLPNDDRVVQKKGSKRVMLKNVQEAKFHSVLLPIAERTLGGAAVSDVKFEPFFTHILAHELMHGLGPHQISIQGRETTPREELKDVYSAIEEAKADVTGLFALQYMMDHAKRLGLEGLLPSGPDAERQLYTTYLASSFRTLRFGLVDAHGKGMAVQFNTFLDTGAYVQNPDGTFRVDMTKIKDTVRDLDRELLTVEAEGDYAGAKKLLNDRGVMRPALQKALDGLRDIPVDIEPVFVTADQLDGGGSKRN